MAGLWSDTRQAIRRLRKRPAFAIAAVAALAVGIGANTATFAVADALIFRPLHLEDEKSVVAVAEVQQGQVYWDALAPADYTEWRRLTRTVEDFAAYEWSTANLTGAGDPERVQAFAVSGGFFRTLRARALFGRTIGPEDVAQGSGRVAVLSHGLWVRRFGSDRGVLGREVRINGANHTIVGVMPVDYKFPPPAEVWLPLALSPQDENSRTAFFINTVARLKSGATLAEAQAEFQAFGRRASEQFPETHARRSAAVVPLKSYIIGTYTYSYTWMMLGSAAFLMLIACANVAVLQFVRSTGRARELAIRVALGAGRRRLLRQGLTESVLLSVAAVAPGILIGAWFIDLMKASMPAAVERYLPGWHSMGIDPVVLAYTIAFAAASGILAGALPAWQSSRGDANDALKESGRMSSGTSRHRVRNVLVGCEIALAIVLLVGAALMAKGVRVMLDPLPQARVETVLTARLTLAETKFAEPAEMRRFYERLMAGMEARFGRSAALAADLPYSASMHGTTLTVEGYAAARGEQLPGQFQGISEEYFRLLRVPVIEGRGFTASDGRDAPQVAIISEALAQRCWPGRSAIGRRLKMAPAETEPWLTVVGVVANVRYDPSERSPAATLYRPYRQACSRTVQLAVRDANPLGVAGALRAAVAAVDPELPIFDVKTMRQMINQTVTGFSYVAGMLSVLGAIALLLAAVGVYSVMAYSVTERTHEIGIRVALGARPADVLRMLAGSGLRIALGGAVAGVALAFGFARLLAGLIFNVSSTEPIAFVGAPMVLGVVAVLASWVPARNATRVDPVIALRAE